MQKLYKCRYIYLLAIIFIAFIFLMVLLPDKAEFSLFGKQFSISAPTPQNIYIWGRKIQLQPNFNLSLDYQAGKFYSFEIDQELSTDQFNDFSKTLASRIKYFYQYPSNLYQLDHQEKQYLIVESLPSVEQEAVEILATQPGKIEFFIQESEISDEQMIMADDWLSNFKKLEISAQNIKNTKAQIDFQSNQPMVALTLDSEGRQNFFRAMRSNTEKMLMIMVDDQVVLLSPIREPIHNGKISIFGGRSLWQANLFASILANPQTDAIIQVPEEEVELNLDQLKQRETESFFGTQLSPLDYHLLALTLPLLVITLYLVFKLKKLGFVFSGLLLLSLMIIATWIRLSGFLVSYQLLVGVFMISLWFLLSGGFLLSEVSYLQKLEVDDFSTVIKKVFSIKRKLVKRLLAVPLITLLLLSLLSGLSLTSGFVSTEFYQALWPVFLVNLAVSVFAVILFSREE